MLQHEHRLFHRRTAIGEETLEPAVVAAVPRIETDNRRPCKRRRQRLRRLDRRVRFRRGNLDQRFRGRRIRHHRFQLLGAASRLVDPSKKASTGEGQHRQAHDQQRPGQGDPRRAHPRVLPSLGHLRHRFGSARWPRSRICTRIAAGTQRAPLGLRQGAAIARHPAHETDQAATDDRGPRLLRLAYSLPSSPIPVTRGTRDATYPAIGRSSRIYVDNRR